VTLPGSPDFYIYKYFTMNQNKITRQRYNKVIYINTNSVYFFSFHVVSLQLFVAQRDGGYQLVLVSEKWKEAASWRLKIVPVNNLRVGSATALASVVRVAVPREYSS